MTELEMNDDVQNAILSYKGRVLTIENLADNSITQSFPIHKEIICVTTYVDGQQTYTREPISEEDQNKQYIIYMYLLAFVSMVIYHLFCQLN